jgi:outer membrane protein assembly factor BamB
MIAASLPDLDLADYFSPANWQLLNRRDLDISAASPVWFTYGTYNLVAGGGKEGVLYLLDADDLGGRSHNSPLYTTTRLGNDELSNNMRGIWGAPTVWYDESGQVWVYVPIWGPNSKDTPKFPKTNGPNSHGSIMAFKVISDTATKKPMLEPAWISGDFNLPDPPVVANGVLLALSTGEHADQKTDRLQNTRSAVLYALDAKTGEVLFESGGLMNSWVHFSGLAIADGRVYAVDHDSWVYCFGPK